MDVDGKSSSRGTLDHKSHGNALGRLVMANQRSKFHLKDSGNRFHALSNISEEDDLKDSNVPKPQSRGSRSGKSIIEEAMSIRGKLKEMFRSNSMNEELSKVLRSERKSLGSEIICLRDSPKPLFSERMGAIEARIQRIKRLSPFRLDSKLGSESVALAKSNSADDCPPKAISSPSRPAVVPVVDYFQTECVKRRALVAPVVEFIKGVTEEQGSDPSLNQARLSSEEISTGEPNVETVASQAIADNGNEGSEDCACSASGETEEESVGSDASESEEDSGESAGIVSGGNKQWTASGYFEQGIPVIQGFPQSHQGDKKLQAVVDGDSSEVALKVFVKIPQPGPNLACNDACKVFDVLPQPRLARPIALGEKDPNIKQDGDNNLNPSHQVDNSAGCLAAVHAKEDNNKAPLGSGGVRSWANVVEGRTFDNKSKIDDQPGLGASVFNYGRSGAIVNLGAIRVLNISGDEGCHEAGDEGRGEGAIVNLGAIRVLNINDDEGCHEAGDEGRGKGAIVNLGAIRVLNINGDEG
ncbi:hypothetical protein U1Q18_023720 [Sarracenia purpurea var. burkii]